MNRLVFIFAVTFCFALGQALKCYKCDLGFWDLCLTREITCNDGEHCYSGIGKAAKFVDVKMKGCLAVAECNSTKEVTFPTSASNATIYHMTKTCCNNDLCNAAPGLPAAPGLSVLLATVAALLVANVAV